jgi:hypothetical protein
MAINARREALSDKSEAIPSALGKKMRSNRIAPIDVAGLDRNQSRSMA